MRTHGLIVALILSALTACSGGAATTSGAAGASGPGGRAGGRGPVEVGVLVLAPQRAALTTELPGRTSAVRVAQVRPQVSGIIQKRLYTEGATVQAGQPLYQIDPGTYRAARDVARAAVSKAEAQLQTTRLRAERYAKLVATGVISLQDRDDVTATLGQAEADLATARAALQSAEINLAYTRIVAPITGRIGTSDFTEGALVTANQADALTSIQQLDPIYVDVTQSADDLLRLRQQFDSGALNRGQAGRAPVRIVLSDGSNYAHPGTLEFTGVTVSESTGAITLRASVPNPEHRLLPGMFVRAVLEQGVSEAALLAPQRSVQRNASGAATAFVVDGAGKVQQRIITTAGNVGNNWLVTAGLAAGDRLVVEGMQKIKEGDLVRIATDVAGAANTAPGTVPH